MTGGAVTTPSLYSYALSFAPDGDIVSANDSVNGNWTYTYDQLNRLATSNLNAGQTAFSYSYDQYGNRWNQTLTAGSGPQPSFSFTGGNNRMDGYSYDAAGNLLFDGTHHYVYDAENRIACVDPAAGTCANGAAAKYVYDAEGRRVRGQSNDYLYDLAGHAITLIDFSGNWNTGEIYAAGRHLATYSGGASGTTIFNHADWLGTERMRTSPTGTVAESCSSLAFGDGLSCTGADYSLRHFTGKERDAESGLDFFGARYYANTMGRWMSPDWSAHPTAVPYADLSDPQTLNLYSYMRNNPLSKADPDGHGGCTVDGEKHGTVWCWAHKHGLVETQKEQADRDRAELNKQGTFFDRQGNRVDLSKVPDAQVIRLYGQYQNNQVPPLASAVFMTQWGWSGSKPYREARDQLKQPGTHENLGGKVPTQDEAVQMIEESGGKIDRIEEGHGPDSISSHNEPHINYTTAGGDKATVIIQAVTH